MTTKTRSELAGNIGCREALIMLRNAIDERNGDSHLHVLIDPLNDKKTTIGDVVDTAIRQPDLQNDDLKWVISLFPSGLWDGAFEYDNNVTRCPVWLNKTEVDELKAIRIKSHRSR